MTAYIPLMVYTMAGLTGILICFTIQLATMTRKLKVLIDEVVD